MTQQDVIQNKTITLEWAGDLTIRRVAELKAQVQGALQSATNISIVLAADAEADMTVLQLLCSAHRTASRQGKVLTLAGEFPEQFKMVLNLAGFSRHIGCALDVCGSCVWPQVPRQEAGPEEDDRGVRPVSETNERI